MSFNFKTGGSWESAASIWTKVAGTWEEVQTAWVKVAGTWERVYQAISVIWNPTSHTLGNVDTSPVTCGIRFNNDGTVDRNFGGVYTQVGTWHADAPSASVGDDFEITAASGGLGTWTSAAAADDTPIALTSDREWNVTQVGPGTKTTNRTFTIGETGNPPNTAAAVCECEAEAN